MNVLFVASEATPLVKVGGLADVVGALPAALHELGHDVRIILPSYSSIPLAVRDSGRVVATAKIPWQGASVPVEVRETLLAPTNTPLYLLHAPNIFDGDAIYYEHSGPQGPRLAEERYVFFSAAVSRILPMLAWTPGLVHCHDWHTGLVPALLTVQGLSTPTVLTIHNMEGQGKWRAEEVFSWLGLRGHESSGLRWRDVDNNLNLLQSGIRTATTVNTVSPTYAQEILTPQYGAGLERDLAARPDGVAGILNGIDVHMFNPATDPRLFTTYSQKDAAAGKAENKRGLQRQLGLPISSAPVFGFVGRLTQQKGIDLLLGAVPTLLDADAQLVVLGSGIPELQERVATLMQQHPRQIAGLIGFDAVLAQHIYAGSDYFLMPSRFEPCGLGQMLAMRYGAIPIVRDTGGLHDSVRNHTSERVGTGLVFSDATIEACTTTVQRALQLGDEAGTLSVLRQAAMAEDFSWRRSAIEYERLYQHAYNPNPTNRPRK